MMIDDNDGDDDVIENFFVGCKNEMNSCLLKIPQLKQPNDDDGDDDDDGDGDETTTTKITSF
jgi:hypothetical protein